MTSLAQIIALCNHVLEPWRFNDYAPNGLQVEGKREVSKLITGVTASQALLDEALEKGADAILVHHGYFWKGEDPIITGIKRNRLKTLLEHDISLIAYHLPLDFHAELGNNAQLAKLLGLQTTGAFSSGEEPPLGLMAEATVPMSADELYSLISSNVSRPSAKCASRDPHMLHIDGGPEQIQRIAICTGAAQDHITAAKRHGADAFITGEVSERTFHEAQELGIHFFAAGHHATERGGVEALGAYLGKELKIDVEFVDIPNPV